MKKHLTVISLAIILFTFSQCKSGLVTMSNGCYDLINQGQTQNKTGNYTAALDNFNKVLQKCDAYDAKEKGYAGKAAALNGMGQYGDALDAANKGLAINKSSLDNLFERANAELGLGRNADAKADLNTITLLTGKNQNTARRATIYSKMAEVDLRQQQYDLALQNIQQAITMDNTNLHFYMQQGDINVAAGNYPSAIASYEDAIAKGKNDAEAWKAKTTTMIRMYQKKYRTDDAATLGKKISTADRETLCNTITTSKQNGVRDMGIDLVQLSVCK
jgi:tetratricopeptide (TPR) repeat protein